MSTIIQFLWQFTLISSALFLGSLIVTIFHLPLPGSIAGMFLLLILLLTGLIKLDWVEKAASFQLQHMTFLFIPPVISAIVYIQLIEKELWKLFLILGISSISIILATGLAVEWYEKFRRRPKK
ncbi:CidA/LrgA family protein [Pseudalkalibacillus salsuginis]|uniref:CidA/LrgA family protein n=1 Tax=Pseudalkalibacillus salsuginis TaxID=2910972 RepID=UPI001F3EC39A|nr:CidA/LrgA family protein [Pseudalkalibacillus salsuginis]MCF6410938.1 CidA/LrgA family protein [Pseudalkalibacillus salsuginis]